MEEPKIHDITAPGDFLPEPTTPWWIWALGAITLLAVTIIITIWLRKPNHAKQRATMLDEARGRLKKLREEAPTLAPHDTATRASLIIRRYLEGAFKDPALFETNEEFTLRPKALSKIHPNCREQIKSYLTKLSQLKYTPSHSDETDVLIDEADDLLALIEINISPAEV